MTEVVDGVRRFRSLPPILEPVGAGDVEALIGGLYARYLETLPLDCAALLSRYSYQGAAHRVVGVGSVGTRALLVLLESGDGEPLLLQLKQAGPSVLEGGAWWSGSGSCRRPATRSWAGPTPLRIVRTTTTCGSSVT
jgi:Uncharacterized protein conserved in bacteria (DUF2252)